MKDKKTGRYVSVCGITIALNIVCIMLLGATPLDAYGCSLAAAVMTPAVAKFGWKSAFPVYLGTAVLGTLFMNPGLAVLYFCVGFQPFAADTDHYGGKRVYLQWLLNCLITGAISSVLLLGLGRILGLEEAVPEDRAVLLFPAMMLLAFFQGVVYRTARKLIYEPVLRPLLDDLMDH